MAVYFQKIRNDQFSAAVPFVVKESVRMRQFIGLLLLFIAFMMRGSSLLAAIAIGAIGLATVLASRKHRTVMTISKDGFFYHGNLVTNWDNFVSATFIDQAPGLSTSSLGISDQFFISIRYYKKAGGLCYERKIALTNMQDKAEEEIMAAIRFFYNSHVSNR